MPDLLGCDNGNCMDSGGEGICSLFQDATSKLASVDITLSWTGNANFTKAGGGSGTSSGSASKTISFSPNTDPIPPCLLDGDPICSAPPPPNPGDFVFLQCANCCAKCLRQLLLSYPDFTMDGSMTSTYTNPGGDGPHLGGANLSFQGGGSMSWLSVLCNSSGDAHLDLEPSLTPSDFVDMGPVRLGALFFGSILEPNPQVDFAVDPCGIDTSRTNIWTYSNTVSPWPGEVGWTGTMLETLTATFTLTPA